MRLSHVRSVFDREYSQKWIGEIFKIHTRFRREGVPVYTLVDWDGERVEGTFYTPELQAMNVDPSTEYHIEQILKRRVRNKKKEIRQLDSGRRREGLLVDQSGIRKTKSPDSDLNKYVDTVIQSSFVEKRRQRHEDYQLCIQRQFMLLFQPEKIVSTSLV